METCCHCVFTVFSMMYAARKAAAVFWVLREVDLLSLKRFMKSIDGIAAGYTDSGNLFLVIDKAGL